MADHVKVIAPRAPTTAPDIRGTGRLTSRLPDDLLNEQIERLAVFSAVVAGLWGFGLAMDAAIVPLLLGSDSAPVRRRHRDLRRVPCRWRCICTSGARAPPANTRRTSASGT